jgi:hypothetical protein
MKHLIRGTAAHAARLALAGIVLVFVAAPSGAAEAAPRLFGPTVAGAAPSDATATDPAARWTLARRPVAPDVDALRAVAERFRVSGAADVVLDLFDDLALDADVLEVERRPSGLTLFLRLRDVELGSAVVTLEGGLVHGHVAFPGGNYTIGTDADGHVVSRIAAHLVPREAPPRRVRPAPVAPDETAVPDPPADSGRLIDVMVVWTPNAVTATPGGATTLAARAQSQIDKSNLVYLNSGIAQRLRLVHTAQVAYTERADNTQGGCGDYIFCALDDITDTNDGRGDAVHGLRTTHGADIVVLFHRDPSPQLAYCGLAWMPTPPQANTAAYGFATVEVTCSNDGISFPHELGHNMGANHDPYVLDPDAADGCTDGLERGAYCYSRGMVSLTGSWRTIMAYTDECFDAGRPFPFCTPIDYMSNPKLTLAGRALGTADRNNNAHTLNRTAKVVANYRATNVALHPVPVQFADVASSHPFFGYIQFFGQTGITSGCGGGNFCPDSPVTREAMAAFLMRGVKATAWTPPAATGVFTDVPGGSPFAPWIEALRNESITSGCTATTYCPTSSVTRGQMAVFLLRASCGPTYTPGPRSQAFGDVPTGHPFFAFVNKLASLGVTTGCGGGNFCVDAPVTRGQMAVFVERMYPFLSPSDACTP